MQDYKYKRIPYELKEGWKFLKSDLDYDQLPDRDDSEWEEVRIPHDWAIEGPFDREHDLQQLSVMEDGVKKDKDHTGRTGGLPVYGTGWYCKKLDIKSEEGYKINYIEFDGVMSNATVYLNGKKVGSWPYGYSSFTIDITKYLNFDHINSGKGSNWLAVKVEPEPLSSRWYPGAGIIREVRRVSVNPVHVPRWGSYIQTPEVSTEQAQVEAFITVQNNTDSVKKVEVYTAIIDHKGRAQDKYQRTVEVKDNKTIKEIFTIDNPRLWDVEDPYLYRIVTFVMVDDFPVDRYQYPFGLRSIEFDAENGFFLNGRNLKLKGVCLHHDHGPLGAAVNKRAIERKLELLQDMGCNAIRTSHNPPSSQLLDLCDKIGFLVIDEAFDEWETGKMKNGYHQYFDQWAEKDLRNMIKRDRNHPSIIMWSIGNEIREQGQEDGAEVAQYLTDICHDEDPTRPVTAGFNQAQNAIDNGLADVVDIVGWNYEYQNYKDYHQEHPDWIMYGSETESCVSSRGEYFFPVEKKEEAEKRENLQLSSYDLGATSWGYIPDYEFRVQEECPFLLGEFVWTGFDYLGEPTPYYTEWPARSSYFGIMDLCGLPKDRYYLYRSHWSEEPTLHLLPHWNWEGKEGETIPVFCYTNYEQAELFLNGESQGVRKKDSEDLLHRYRLIWNNVRYEPGTLKVVAYDEQGESVLSKEIKTAGEPAQINLEPAREEIRADQNELCYITAKVTDEDGNLCLRADNLINFEVGGLATIEAVGNGNPATTEPFKADYRHVFNGQCVVIVRVTDDAQADGFIKVKARSDELKTDEVEIRVKPIIYYEKKYEDHC